MRKKLRKKLIDWLLRRSSRLLELTLTYLLLPPRRQTNVAPQSR